ncbi:hypothetical protein FRC05_008841, partial [Tulasnella sp. 425]
MSAFNAGVIATDVWANPSGVTLSAFLRYILIGRGLAGGELIDGAAEGFGGVVNHGQSIPVWSRDVWAVPFYLSSRGYGTFVNHPSEVEPEAGSEKMSRVGISIVGEELEVFVIYGPTPEEVRVMHVVFFWRKQYEWCNFTFDPYVFPNPVEYLRNIKEKSGVQVCVLIKSYISQGSSLFEEGLEGGSFIKRTNGDVWNGFECHPPREIYMRWRASGAFSSHTRLHGSSSYRVPWNFNYDTENDTSAPKAVAKFIDASIGSPSISTLRYEQYAAHETGVPVQRHTMLELPTDGTTLHLDHQFMLGRSLLVAPVLTTEYYVPGGKWTSFWYSSKVVQGPSSGQGKASGEAVVPDGKSTEKAATLRAERKDGKVTVKV